jgi:hypothetical protein
MLKQLQLAVGEAVQQTLDLDHADYVAFVATIDRVARVRRLTQHFDVFLARRSHV